MSKWLSEDPGSQRRIVINDASCLIDLHKVGLIGQILRLPYQFQVVLPVRENELLTISSAEWAVLGNAGLTTVDLDPDAVQDAFNLKQLHGSLSPEDCFSLVLARRTKGAVLLTSDRPLRVISESYQVEAHGLLWVLDELIRHQICDGITLSVCLEAWRDDPLVWLPGPEVVVRLRRYTQ